MSVLVPQFPPLSHCAIASQLTGSAWAWAVATTSGTPTTAPATTTRAMLRNAADGLRCLPSDAISLLPSTPTHAALWDRPFGEVEPGSPAPPLARGCSSSSLVPVRRFTFSRGNFAECSPDRTWRYGHSGLAWLVGTNPEATVRTKLRIGKLQAL